MNKSLYPEGVEVHQRHLENTETTKAADIRQSRLDATSRGVVSGLGVTVNISDPTKVDVAAGAGYTPNGEYVVLGAGQSALSVPNNPSAGLQSYVLLVYDEVASSPEAHETDGTTRNTKAVSTPRLVLLTAAAFNSLPNTDPVLSNNAKDRALILAIVTGTPGGGLTATQIQSPSGFSAVLQSNQPINISGITILSIDSTTATGAGTLFYTFSPQELKWQAPGEGSPGAALSLTTSGVDTVISSGGKALQVNITFSQLPVGNQTDQINVVNLYAQTVPRHTALDIHHRAYIGSGIPTIKNPHGTTIDDLSPGVSGTLEGHQDLMHANGIIRVSASSLLTGTVNTGPAPDTLSLIGFATGDAAYVNGKRIESLTSSTTVTFGDGILEPSTYGLFLGQDGNIFKQVIAKFPVASGPPDFGTSLLFDKLQILDVVGVPAGAYTLTWTSAGAISFNSGPTVSAPSVTHIIRAYSSDRVGYVDLLAKGSATPGVTQADSITISALPNAEEVIPVLNIAWAGSSFDTLGFGFGAASFPNEVFDKRLFGTLTEFETRKDAGMINTSLLMNEVLGDGILVRSRIQSGTTNNEVTVASAFADQFALSALSFPNITLNGGVIYVGGRRFEVATNTLTMTDNATNRIYVNSNGVVQTSTSAWSDIVAPLKGKPISRLYEVVITSTVETSRTSLREFVGQKRDVAMGVVALNVNKQAFVNSTGDGLLAIQATGSDATGASVTGGTGVIGLGGDGTGSNPGGDGVVGIAGDTPGTRGGRGVYGESTNFGIGVEGVGGNDTGAGVRGTGGNKADNKEAGIGVEGIGGDASSATSGGSEGLTAIGVRGVSGSPNAPGVQGEGNTGVLGMSGVSSVSTPDTLAGVRGVTNTAIGVLGEATTANGVGVWGQGAGTGPGVFGRGTTVGVDGQGAGTLGIGVRGKGASGTFTGGIGGRFTGGTPTVGGVGGTAVLAIGGPGTGASDGIAVDATGGDLCITATCATDGVAIKGISSGTTGVGVFGDSGAAGGAAFQAAQNQEYTYKTDSPNRVRFIQPHEIEFDSSATFTDGTKTAAPYIGNTAAAGFFVEANVTLPPGALIGQVLVGIYNGASAVHMDMDDVIVSKITINQSSSSSLPSTVVDITDGLATSTTTWPNGAGVPGGGWSTAWRAFTLTSTVANRTISTDIDKSEHVYIKFQIDTSTIPSPNVLRLYGIRILYKTVTLAPNM